MHGFGQGHKVKQCGAKVRAKVRFLGSLSTAGFYCDFQFDNPESLVPLQKCFFWLIRTRLR